MLPVAGGGFVVRGQHSYVLVAFGGEGGAGVDDVDLCGGGTGWSEADVDGGDQDVWNEIGVLEVAAFKIEEGVDPK